MNSITTYSCSFSRRRWRALLAAESSETEDLTLTSASTVLLVVGSAGV